MVSYFVRYCGASSVPDAFQAYYETRHAALLRQFPHIRSLILHRPAAWNDPFQVRPGETFLLAQMQFDGADDLGGGVAPCIGLAPPPSQSALGDVLSYLA